ncbi:MAG: Dihydropteroate synthase [Ignavibacteriae bacterium]|nr:MAG: Dihydropteroate synthase [Ignavibacteriota bacterium]
MGILNITPDSFSDGGRYYSTEKAIEHALRMEDEGADFIDIGGESTRPGAESVSVEEELKRVIPVIEKLAGKIEIPISIDTTKSEVARKALDTGAEIVNDISATNFDPDMIKVISDFKPALILMHIKGSPKTMQINPDYIDVIKEIKDYLQESVNKCRSNGIEQIIVDPGIGFGKKLEHNIEIFKRLSELKELGCPILIGPSRKSFIGQILDLPVEQRLEGTAAAVAVSILRGANIVRVHDVKEIKRVVKIVDALK